MSKQNKKVKIRKEDNLCVLIRRDLDSCVLFKGHTYFSEQYDIKTGKSSSKADLIDFLVYYKMVETGRKLFFGIEAKAERPNLSHLKQANRYLDDRLNGIFLAYPESMIPEALDKFSNEPGFEDIGLISLNPYKSFVCKKAGLNTQRTMKKEILEEFSFDSKEPAFNDSGINPYNSGVEGFVEFINNNKNHAASKRAVTLLSLFIANSKLRGADSDLPNCLPKHVEDQNYSINTILGKDSKEDAYDILKAFNIIELGRGYYPFMYSFTEYAQQKKVYSILSESINKESKNVFSKHLTSVFKTLQRSEIQQIFEEVYEKIKKSA